MLQFDLQIKTCPNKPPTHATQHNLKMSLSSTSVDPLRTSASAPTPLVAAIQDIFAGTIGGMMTVLVGHPFDTIKVRMQVSAERFPTLKECVRQTWRENGVREFYKG